MKGRFWTSFNVHKLTFSAVDHIFIKFLTRIYFNDSMMKANRIHSLTRLRRLLCLCVALSDEDVESNTKPAFLTHQTYGVSGAFFCGLKKEEMR